jgi:hypothetical protein
MPSMLSVLGPITDERAFAALPGPLLQEHESAFTFAAMVESFRRILNQVVPGRSQEVLGNAT